jgi:hypothetical protein
MEEAAVTIMASLSRAIIPTGVLAAFVGLVAIGTGLLALRDAGHLPQAAPRPEEAQPVRVSENIAVTLCAFLAALGVVAVAQILRYGPGNPAYLPVAMLFAAALLALSLPTLLWRTRFRLFGEGAATLTVAVASVLTGFSIGLLLVPLVLLMTWVCLRHLFHRFSGGQRHSSVATR